MKSVRIGVITGLISVLAAVQLGSLAHAQDAIKEYTRVAVACCVEPDRRQRAWEPIRRFNPDLVLMMGDMIDVNADDLEDLTDGYEVLSRSRGLRLIRQSAYTMAVWNEYDYALNGRVDNTHKHKAEVRQHFIEYWNEPYNTERYYRQDGLYGSMFLGQGERRIQILMLDTRWHRQPLKRASWWQRQIDYWWHQRGSWQAESGAKLLGNKQWEWLEAQLQQPAAVRIIASSIPILAGEQGFDTWSLFGNERQKLRAVLQRTNANGVILVGAGTHWGDLSYDSTATDYGVWQLTPGSINQNARFIPANPFRAGRPSVESRYGTVEVFWRADDPLVTIATRDVDGRVINQEELSLSELGSAAVIELE